MFVVPGCGDDIQYTDPPKKDPAASPHRGLPAGHPPVSGSERIDPHGAAAGSGDPFADPADAGKAIRGSERGGVAEPDRVYFSGRVELDPSQKLPPTYTVYVNAGHPPDGRPPVLSRPYPGQPRFPLEFELRGKDLAFGDSKVEGPLVLYASLSESGAIPLPGSPVQGIYFKTRPGQPVGPGSTGIVITLKQP